MELISKSICIVLLFVSLSAIIAGGIGQYRILLMKREAGKIKKGPDTVSDDGQWGKKKRRNYLTMGKGLILGVFSVIFALYLFSDGDSIPQTESSVTDTEINQYLNTISAEFGELRPNDCKTKWEDILDKNLGANQYGSDKSVFDYETFNGDILLLQNNRATTAERIHNLYKNNAAFVIEPEYLLSEINNIIKNAEDIKSINIEIHKQEIILYAGDIFGREDSISRASIYQAGRAAHDVVNCLCQETEIDVREIIFYAALAKEYYGFAIGMPINGMKSVNRYDEYILYRMGMLFDTLAKVEKLKEYHEHFLLEAASFYALASETGEGRDGMSENHIYNVDYYRGCVLYHLYNLGREDQKECIVKYIENYLEIKNTIPVEFRVSNAEENCEYILKRLGSG